MRSINTSIVALLPVGALLYVGVVTLGSGALKDLALALFVGMAAGAYSSIFIATPLLVQLKEREPGVKAGDARARSATAAVTTVDRFADVPVFAEDMPIARRARSDADGAGGAGPARTAATAGATGRCRREPRAGSPPGSAPASARPVSRHDVGGPAAADAQAALAARQGLSE